MRLGILTQYFPPEPGAPSARFRSLVSAAVARGHSVCVVTAMPNYPSGVVSAGYGGLYRNEHPDGIRIVRSYIHPSNSLRLAPRLASYGSFAASSVAVGAFALPRLDVLITESPPLTLGVSGWMLSRLKQARWVFNVSDLWPKSAVELGVLSDKRVIRAAEALERFCYERAWRVSGQSESILTDIKTRFPQVHTVPLLNGVDTEAFKPELRSEEMRRVDFAGAPVVALYAGLHGLAQGLTQVLGAAALLRDVADLTIVMVGDGPERVDLVEKARAMGLTNVRFLGGRPAADIPRLLASADIALVPLKSAITGAVPSKMYEAFASGVAVALAAEGEAAAILDGARAGIAVPPGDEVALAQAIRTLANEPAQRAEFGRAGRLAAMERFDRTKNSDAFLEKLEADL